MRNNQPITQREFTFSGEQSLISSTDTRGIISYCNQAFIDVSGFSREELIGANHNLVRHPDMPEAVFKEMWNTLKSGKNWMGLVKNRRKNGDHYWVSAYVTPIYENRQIIGYESVRVPATTEQRDRADAIYTRIRNQKPVVPVGKQLLRGVKSLSVFLTLGPPLIIILALTSGWVSSAVATATLLMMSAWHLLQQDQSWKELIQMSPHSFSDETVAQTYFDDPTSIARGKLVLECELARSRTALTRIKDAAFSLGDIADSTQEQAVITSNAVEKQNEATQQIVSAVTQMSHSIKEVAERVSTNAEAARSASENVATSNTKAESAATAIHDLRDVVESISLTVTELDQSTGEIGEAANIISSIADQTNLLALNAAIEAARAGEQGRGFAVVADEVRALASKTRESTDRIHSIIQTLASRSERAVTASATGLESAKRGADIVEETQLALTEVNKTVGGIADITFEMSAAVEQQSSVAEHINQQVVEIAQSATDTLKSSETSLQASERVNTTIGELNSVITRFSAQAK